MEKRIGCGKNNRKSLKTKPSASVSKFNDNQMKFSTDTSSNRFSVLKCEDVEKKDVDDKDKFIESISDKIQKGNGLKRKRNTIKKDKKQKRLRNTKMAKSSQINNKPLTATWARCRQCFLDQFPRRKFCKRNTLKKQFQKHGIIETKILTSKQAEIILQHIAFLEHSKSTKSSVVVKIAGNKYFSRDNFWPYRLRGGADSIGIDEDVNEPGIEDYFSSLHNSASLMVNKAIEDAKFHNINLYHGVPNMADGNCAFESIIDNITTRQCFGETYDGTPDHWRFVWMSEIENIAFNDWHGSMSMERWKAEFQILKHSRSYELELGDLVVPGIAHCTRKNILIFNTSEQAHSPIYVIPATTFGGTANTDIPVCLAYNQVHYEGLVPCSEEDIQKL